jgi:PPOX class probable F420-dependent enzyme
MTAHLEDLMTRRSVLLTTYRRDGTAVGTKVHIAVQEGRAYVRTYGKAWKWKRVRNHPDNEIDGLPVRGRILEGEEATRAARALASKYPILHGLLIPRAHRLMRTPTIHMEFTPAARRATAGSPVPARDRAA